MDLLSYYELDESYNACYLGYVPATNSSSLLLKFPSILLC